LKSWAWGAAPGNRDGTWDASTGAGRADVGFEIGARLAPGWELLIAEGVLAGATTFGATATGATATGATATGATAIAVAATATGFRATGGRGLRRNRGEAGANCRGKGIALGSSGTGRATATETKGSWTIGRSQVVGAGASEKLCAELEARRGQDGSGASHVV